MKLIHHSVLLFQAGSSDKIYEAELLELADNQYIVNFRYGRRGSNLKQDSKTKQPVGLTEAEKIFKSLLVSKINKGYRLIQGFDPLTTTDPAHSAAQPAHNSGDVRAILLQHLSSFLEAAPKSFEKDFHLNRHRLSRCLWQIGQLRMAEAVPLILELYQQWPASKNTEKHLAVLNYTLVWLMGRIGDARFLPLIEEMALRLPDNQQYLIEAARLSIWNEAQRQKHFTLMQNQQRSIAELIAQFDEIAEFNQFKGVYFHALSAKELHYAHCVLDWRGIKTEVLEALQNAKLVDSPDTFIQAMPASPRTVIESDLSIYQPLIKATAALKTDRLAELLDEMFEGQSKDQSLYEQVLSKIDLKGELNLNPYEENYVRQGWLSWLWQGAKDNLIGAIQKTGLIQNVRDFFDRITQYQQYQHLRHSIKRLTTEERSSHLSVLEQFGVKAQVLKALQTRHLYVISHWDFFETQLDPETRSKVQGDLKVQVSRLLFHRQAELKNEILQQKASLLNAFEKQFIQRVHQSHFSSQGQIELKELLSHMQLSTDSFRFYRKLFKLLCFYDEFELLAQLIHQLESTGSLSGQSYSSKTRQYFRRRAMTLLKQLGNHQAEQFVELARALLLQIPPMQAQFESQCITRSRYQESGRGNWRQVTHKTHYPEYGHHLSLSFLLRATSRKCVYHAGKSAWIDKSPEHLESIRTEAFPEIWNQHPDLLFDLLKASEHSLVLDFAFKALQAQTQFCANLPVSDWAVLLSKSELAIAQFALRHVQGSLGDRAVLLAAAHSPFFEIRQAVFGSLTALKLIEHPQVLAVLFVSTYDDLNQKVRGIWQFVHQQKAAVLTHILDYLFAQADAELIQSFKEQALAEFSQEISVDHVMRLLQSDRLDLQLLAIDLIHVSQLDYQSLAPCLSLIQSAQDSRVQAGALAILGKLPQTELLLHLESLTLALLSHDAALRQQACLILHKLPVAEFQAQVFQEIVPHLFLKEPVEGFTQDLLSVIAQFEPMAATLDKELLWRLLMARSKLAQGAGALLIQWRNPKEFSIKQIARLTRHAVLSARQWALASLAQDPERVWQELSDAIQALDNPWQDTRRAGIHWFESEFADREWPLPVAIALCDQVYDDVQAFGHKVLSPWLEQTPLECLSKLSQHPDLPSQHFVARYLEQHVAGQIETILSLKPYFVTVLSRVNQGRSIKDLLIPFLCQQALEHPELAPMVTEILSEQSLSRIVNDKARYIQGLYHLQLKHPELKSPLQIVPPQRRSYGVSV